MKQRIFTLDNADDAVNALFDNPLIRQALTTRIRVTGAVIASYFMLYYADKGYWLEYYDSCLNLVKRYELQLLDDGILGNFGLPSNPLLKGDALYTDNATQFPMGIMIKLIMDFSVPEHIHSNLVYAHAELCRLIMGEEVTGKPDKECADFIASIFSMGDLEHYGFETFANDKGFIFKITQLGTYIGQIVFIATQVGEQVYFVPDSAKAKLACTN